MWHAKYCRAKLFSVHNGRWQNRESVTVWWIAAFLLYTLNTTVLKLGKSTHELFVVRHYVIHASIIVPRFFFFFFACSYRSKVKTGIYTYALNRDENLILLRAGLFPRCNFSAIGFSLSIQLSCLISITINVRFSISNKGGGGRKGGYYKRSFEFYSCTHEAPRKLFISFFAGRISRASIHCCVNNNPETDYSSSRFRRLITIDDDWTKNELRNFCEKRSSIDTVAYIYIYLHICERNEHVKT